MNDQNKELVSDLYKKLNWFTFQCREEEFDAAQVKSILDLLDVLDPIDNSIDLDEICPDKNVPSAPEISNGHSSEKNIAITFKFVKAAASLLAAVFAIKSLSLNTTAYREKSFFEILHDGSGSMKITVTGSEGNSPYIIRYDSWWVLKNCNPDLMTPAYLPNNVSLEQLSERDHGSYTDFVGIYSKNLTITVRSFRENYAGDLLYNGWELFDILDGIEYYKKDGKYKLSFPSNRFLYIVEWNDLDEILKIIKSFT